MARIEHRPCILDDGTVVRVRIIYESRLQQLIARIFGMEATTIWNTIRYFCRADQLNTTTIAHEMQHVRQWHRYGVFGFLWHYYGQAVLHGYDHNMLEQEARAVAGEPLR